MFDKTKAKVKEKLGYFAMINKIVKERDVSKKEAAEIIRSEGLMGKQKEEASRQVAEISRKEPKPKNVSEIGELEELAEINPYFEVADMKKNGSDSADCLWHMCGRYHELAVRVKAKLIKEYALLKRDNELLESKIKPDTEEIKARLKELLEKLE